MPYTPISFLGGGGPGLMPSAPAPSMLPAAGGGIYPNAPRSIKSFTRKYQQLAPVLYGNYGPGIASSLQAFEQQRAARGINPLSKQQTIRIATAAQRNETNIPERESGLSDIFGNAVSDLYAIGSGIVKLPFEVVEQAQQLPRTVQQLPGMVAQGNIAGALQLPGINLIPGAYTASNLISGNTQEMIEHPLFTALDVLPYASKGLKGAAPKVAAKAQQVPQIQAAGLAMRGSKPYQFVQGAFGKNARTEAFIRNRITTELSEAAHPDMPLGRFGDLPAAQITRSARELQVKYPTITKDERLLSDLHDTGTLYPDRIADLPAEQQAYLSEYKSITSQLQRHAVESTDKLAFGEWVGGDELFPKEQARTLFTRKSRAELSNTMVNVREGLLEPVIDDPLAFAQSAPDSFMRAGFDTTPASANNTYPVRIRKQIAEGYARTLDMAGTTSMTYSLLSSLLRLGQT